MTNSNSKPFQTEAEKQLLPLPGEVALKDALAKASMFAVMERERVKVKQRATPQASVNHRTLPKSK